MLGSCGRYGHDRHQTNIRAQVLGTESRSRALRRDIVSRAIAACHRRRSRLAAREEVDGHDVARGKRCNGPQRLGIRWEFDDPRGINFAAVRNAFHLPINVASYVGHNPSSCVSWIGYAAQGRPRKETRRCAGCSESMEAGASDSQIQAPGHIDSDGNHVPHLVCRRRRGM